MNYSWSFVVLVLTSYTISLGIAFEQRLELLPDAHRCTQRSHRFTLRLSAFTPESIHARNGNESKRLRTSESDFVPTLFDGLDDFSLLFDNGVFDGTFPFLQKQANTLALETFVENELLGMDAWDNCGDDCKQCEIPKDWCVPDESINVMEYLGVKRVEPLI